MKKIISVLLAVLMIFSSMAIVAGATDYTDDSSAAEDRFGVCSCDDHKNAFDCGCCVHCKTTDDNYRTNCAVKKVDSEGNEYYKVCCSKCTGIYPCECGCPCCDERNEDVSDKNDSTLDDYITEQDKEAFVDGFQAILKKISDFFDMVFDAIFEFLRLDEVLGRNPEA